MKRRRARHWARIAALVGIAAANGACANRGAEVEWTDRLLARERSVYAARTRDADAALRLAAEVPVLLASTCEEVTAARVARQAERIEIARLSGMVHFEASAWTLQWEIEPLIAEQRFGSLNRRIDAAAIAAESAAAQAATRPNDSRLAARAAAAAAEQSRLRGEGLVARRDAALGLAARIDALRDETRARIDSAYAPILEDLRAAAIAACLPPDVQDPVIGAARRAAYAELHSAQVEGLVVLRRGGDRPDRALPLDEAARNTLASAAPSTSTTSRVAPAFEAELARVERAIRAAERELTARIDASFDELDKGARTSR